MSENKTGQGRPERPAEDERSRRLAEELRANLKRRKAQARSRKTGSEADAGSESGASGDE